MTFLQQILNDGAPISYVILGCFVVATFLFFQRFFYLHRANIDCETFLLGIFNNIKNKTEKKTVEAIMICDQTPSPVASMVKSILCGHNTSEASLRRTAEEATLIEIPRMQRNARLISVIGQTSPMLGLFGTVLSLMSLFNKIGEGTTGASMSISQMAPDVRTALITTAMGITVAMIVSLYNAILSERCHAIVYDMEKTATELITFLVEPENLADSINETLIGESKNNSDSKNQDNVN